jgi:4-hydroxythreonine-4-phosphate dehydrogenase
MEDGGVETEDPRLVERLGELLAPEAAAVGGLILTGGATAVALLRAWGTTALRIQAELDPGVVLSETVGARRVPVVTKAGAFGDRGTLTRAREQLRKDGPGTKNQEQGTK